ncbi:MAG: alpha/beta fold hydrolase [Nodosilinea sp.]
MAQRHASAQNSLAAAASAAGVSADSCPKVYFISGLGADWRVFQYLRIEGYCPVHIQWERPQRREPIEHYASRLMAQIATDQPILVGLSFGGLVAIEMAKQCHPTQVILLSSAKTAAEIPVYYRPFRWLALQQVIPFKSLLWAVYGLINWLFSLDTPAERMLLKQILLDTDPCFLKWALNRVVLWRNQEIPENLIHIHGGRDRIFPLFNVSADIVIEDGGHLMVVNRAEKISALLAEVLAVTPGEALCNPRRPRG